MPRGGRRTERLTEKFRHGVPRAFNLFEHGNLRRSLSGAEIGHSPTGRELSIHGTREGRVVTMNDSRAVLSCSYIIQYSVAVASFRPMYIFKFLSYSFLHIFTHIHIQSYSFSVIFYSYLYLIHFFIDSHTFIFSHIHLFIFISYSFLHIFTHIHIHTFIFTYSYIQSYSVIFIFISTYPQLNIHIFRKSSQTCVDVPLIHAKKILLDFDTFPTDTSFHLNYNQMPKSRLHIQELGPKKVYARTYRVSISFQYKFTRRFSKVYSNGCAIVKKNETMLGMLGDSKYQNIVLKLLNGL